MSWSLYALVVLGLIYFNFLVIDSGRNESSLSLISSCPLTLF